MTAPQAADIARALAHDVGKHISRAARNIHELPPTEPLTALLLEDLYLLDGSRRASEVFHELATRFRAPIDNHPDIALCKAHLARIDALEPAVRSGEPDAVREACTRALSIDETLRQLARSLAEGNRP